MDRFSDFSVTPRPVRQFMRSLATSAQGMATQQKFLDIIAENISNAETTRTAEGGAYKRQVAVASRDPRSGEITLRVVEDNREGRVVHDPAHPDADENGNVFYPNVDMNAEMVDLMLARRLHEANLSAFQTAKQMLRRAIDI
ncbi:MAG: flagellar basal body rod protein FlgC [Gemmatimonadales bacterium]|nr:flagellar basal body rod protein FlgC [Gemmatimonadales bacterium]